MANTLKTRPEFRNINALSDLPSYRLPRRASSLSFTASAGQFLFLLLPFIIWLFDKSVTSEISFEVFRNAYTAGIGVAPAWFVKLVTLAILWGYLHHFIAGVRHLWMDATHSVSKEQGKSSAIVTLALGTLLTLALGAKLFGLY